MLERVSRLFGRSSSFHRDEAVSEDPIETLSAEPEDPVAADGPQVVTDERTIRENGWKPIEVDRAYPWFEPQHGLYVDGAPVIPYRADTVIDAWSTKHFTVRAATVRGYGHRFNKRHEPRQDDFALGIHDPSETLFIAVADGVSKAKQSHYGATVVCRYALEWAMRSLAEDQSINWDELSHGAAWALVEFGHTHLGLPREAAAAEKALATTLSVAIVRPDERGATATVVAMGDSGVWLLEAARYDSLAGRKAEEGGLVSNLVTALPRVPDRLEPATVHISEDQVFLVGTDGFGDPLGSGKGLVGQLFAAELAEPPYPLRFAHILDFSRETFDDDRTLIAIWPFGRDRSNTISDRGTVGATGRERGLNLRVNDQ